MKSLLLLFVFLSALMGSEAETTRYKVMLSLFGKVGEAKITIAERGDEYRMIVEDYATGLAAEISGHERDRFVSRGRIVDGLYVSDTFELYQTNDKTTESNVYVFDHEAETVTRFQDKNETVTETTFDAMSMRLVEKQTQKIKRKTEVLDFYSPYDALSVVLNIPSLLKDRTRVEIKPVGLAKKERKMYIGRPEASALSELQETFHTPTIRRIVQLDSFELEDEDEYGVLIGYNAQGGIDEVVTKETYFLIGFGRIEKIGASRRSVAEIFDE
ncbi:DUF3108 domain-containing protein [Sulfurimonas diazotrophicus]|uniref:DUF3108 domain-containing protein n=1 Tax=Sulfurimonas diazotrophicus TaxID=3131939 RepID=A0ABZ3H9L6_9BACT